MKTVKYNPFKPWRPVGINHFFDDFAGKTIADFLGSDHVNSSPSVNVIEQVESYLIEVAAPGLSKEDFQIDLENNQLIISSKKEICSEKTDEGRYTRREFNYESFQRSFLLSEDIKKEEIKAAYSNGVLTIELLKKEEAKDIKKTIEIR